MLTFFWKKMRRNQKGFTLIELIVVIAILGVLAAIAVPNVMGTLSRAKEDADKATAATIANAALEYLMRENPDNADAINNKAVDSNNVLITNHYLKEVPTPQYNPKDNTSFYIVIKDYNTSTNPIIEIHYNDANGTLLYPTQTANSGQSGQ